MGIKQAGLSDNCALSGHSLLATQVISPGCASLRIGDSLKTLFAASQLGDCNRRSSARPRPTVRPIERSGTGAAAAPLLCNSASGSSTNWNPIAPSGTPRHLTANSQLDVAALQPAFTSLIERHESLRTVFGPRWFVHCKEEKSSSPAGRGAGRIEAAVQLIAPPLRATTFTIAVSRLPIGKRHNGWRRWQPGAASLRLGHGARCCRLQLLQIADDDALLVIVMHHIISDGWSVEPSAGRPRLLRLRGENPPCPRCRFNMPTLRSGGESTARAGAAGRRWRHNCYWRCHRRPALLERPPTRPLCRAIVAPTITLPWIAS
ncbi:MAG: hypothetical protein R3E79_00250 [Caldilineaceae bacterium]